MIKEFVQVDTGIKLILCPSCYSPAEKLKSLEFNLFVPSINVAECIEFICHQNPCFASSSTDEGTAFCSNSEHDNTCKSPENADSLVETVVANVPSTSSDVLHCNTANAEGSNCKDNDGVMLNQQKHQGSADLGAAHQDISEVNEIPIKTDTVTCSIQFCGGYTQLISSTRQRAHTYEEIPGHQPYNQCSETPDTPCQCPSIKKVNEPCESASEAVQGVPDQSATVKMEVDKICHFYEKIPFSTSQSPGICSI